ncbi:Rrp15p-domain-containing protein [Suhomyces tanzawaensis NRRL Y-17324]|uniref:Rrp15p-domain-containing protein n=1 Tax=Suhomyces tanzawaensis NRRL Y-17324 TaxID=984487 RepID=A0A1E4SSC0_9ASCO|nr:Rrp15p-domain-containing protein [Suhomyces tanzawaensis NRRL Y-17324]ODV82395.1 Rrp15p-domain-containing protein [Suhomyces tanzawaensis NRRL Y-17324]
MGSALKKQKKNDHKPKAVAPPASLSSESESEVESASEEELEDLDMDDEVDIDGVSSDSEDEAEEDDEDEEADEALPKLKKKKNLDDGSESFAGAFNAILGSRLKAYDRKDPILARNKLTIKKLESDKLEAKAKRALLSEKKSLHDKHRITELLPSANEPGKVREIIENERKLKKVAQKGVVRLFNAVLSTQVRTNQDMDKEIGGQSKKEELMNEISKEKFLDLVQAAGQD